jgi:hypothetical protein
MDNTSCSHLTTSKIIDNGFDKLVEAEGYTAYTCGYLAGIINSISIFCPEARTEIARAFETLDKVLEKNA